MASSFPPPRAGEVVLAEGSKRCSLALVEAMICDELERGMSAIWIDGGMVLDPSALISSLSRRGLRPTLLDNLRVCRAFTAHQMVEVVRRVESDISSDDGLQSARLIVTTELACMFPDEQVKPAEGRSMLRSSMAMISSLAKERGMLALVTANYRRAPGIPRDMRSTMREIADDRVTLLSYSDGLITSRLASVGITSAPLSSVSHPTLLDFAAAGHMPRVVCEDPHDSSSASETPKGEINADAARRARAS